MRTKRFVPKFSLDTQLHLRNSPCMDLRGDSRPEPSKDRTDSSCQVGNPRFLDLKQGTLPSSDTSSDSSWQTALRWINTCTKQHGGCKTADSMTYVPDRLLDVACGPDVVRVVETGAMVSRGGSQDDSPAQKHTRRASMKPLTSGAEKTNSYVTLSHCWGKTRSDLLLTKETYASHTGKAGITKAKLPKTFQDAIFLTRKLGVRYLWIDSLCIIQNSKSDWQTQSAQMSLVYSHSWLTIAATSSSTDDSGIFHHPDILSRSCEHKGRQVCYEAKQHTVVRHGRPHTVYSRLTRPHPDEHEAMIDFPSSQRLIPSQQALPLLSRGWVLQERLLSQRVLHFGDSELYWECMEGVGCECSYQDLSKWRKGSKMTKTFPGCEKNTKSSYSVLQQDHKKRELYSSWRRLCQVYMQLELTFAKDRLAAMSGVAKQFRHVLKDTYLAGCWRESLIRDICWKAVEFPTDSPRPVTGSPTWSWSSASPGAIEFELILEPRLKIHHAEIYPCGEDDTGQVSGGRLEVEASAINISLKCGDQQEDCADARGYCTSFAVLDISNETFHHGYKVQFYPDSQFWATLDDLTEQLTNVTFVPMRCTVSSDWQDGLLLKERLIRGSMTGFERLGWLEMRYHPGNELRIRLDGPTTKLTLI